MFEVCADIYRSYPVVNDVGLFLFVFAWIQVASGIIIVLWQRYQVWMALKATSKPGMHQLATIPDSDIHQQKESSNTAAARLVVLPIYNGVLFMFAVADFYQGIISVIFPLYLEKENSVLASACFGSSWALYHVTIEGCALLLLQQGAGTEAAKRASKFAMVWGVITFGIQYFVFRNTGSTAGFALQVSYELALFLFYSYLWLAPNSWLFRRPSVSRYSRFWTLMRAQLVASAFLRHEHYQLGYCFYDVAVGLFFGLLKPWIMFQTLLDDSHYWCGLFEEEDDDMDTRSGSILGNLSAWARRRRHSEGSLSRLEHSTNDSVGGGGAGGTPDSPKRGSEKGASIRAPLIGTSFKRDAAKHLALGIDKFARTKVRLLNYAFLSLDSQRKVLGVGGSARVFEGRYRGKPVAVKMVFCVELTPNEVASFIKEASTLATLNHPNVVHLEGVCVRPPSICLVMELCAFGSLYDVLHNPGCPIPLTWTNRVLMALQCAQGVAYLHRMKPPMLHLDLKSGNFLVAFVSEQEEKRLRLWHQKQRERDEQNEKRESKDSKDSGASRDHQRRREARLLRDYPDVQGDGARFLVKVADMELSITTQEALQQSSQGKQRFVVPETVNWTAPEMLRGSMAHVSPKADCYSLGSVLFEILTLRIPFQEFKSTNNYDQRRDLIDAICEKNYRPTIPPDTDPRYAQLIRDLWDPNPAQRPNAEAVVEVLRRILDSTRKPGDQRGRVDSLPRDIAAPNSPNRQVMVAGSAPPAISIAAARAQQQQQKRGSNNAQHDVAGLLTSSSNLRPASPGGDNSRPSSRNEDYSPSPHPPRASAAITFKSPGANGGSGSGGAGGVANVTGRVNVNVVGPDDDDLNSPMVGNSPSFGGGGGVGASLHSTGSATPQIAGSGIPASHSNSSSSGRSAVPMPAGSGSGSGASFARPSSAPRSGTYSARLLATASEQDED